MSTASRFLGLGVALGLAAGLLVGVGLTPGRAATTGPSDAPEAAASGVAGTSAPPAVAKGGTATAQAGTAIAYPYVAGYPGLAPEHTIVVTGLGQADMQADGSDRATAQETALSAALTDAKAQAEAIALAAGLSISGVYSVSASTSPVYGVMPMPGATSGSASGEAMPPVAQPMYPEPVYPQTLAVSVTVAYQVD